MKGEIKTLCFKPTLSDLFFQRTTQAAKSKGRMGWEALEDGGRKEGNTMVQERDRESSTEVDAAVLE